MTTLYSNGPSGDFVIAPYKKLLAKTSAVFVASPYVTMTSDLAEAANRGKAVNLLVGLNASTDPAALRCVFGIPNLSIRYYTNRFHAKVYLFDECALLGSSNLTDGGMQSNREATLFVEQIEQVQELRALCQELWSGAPVLTPEVLSRFETAVGPFGRQFDMDARIATAVGPAQPPNITVGSSKKTSEYIFLEALRRRVYEQFKPSFDEVALALTEPGLHRNEWSSTDKASEVNRFLNWVRLIHGAGDEWQQSPLRSKEERRTVIEVLGKEWAHTKDARITDDYFDNMHHLRSVFATRESLEAASRESLSDALMGVHAFEEQIRFIKGGYKAIIEFFWTENGEDVVKVKKSLDHLIFGKGDFIARLYDVLNFPDWKIRYFGESCALELSGTVRPNMCPPMNGRSAKGLRYIGFNVSTS